MSNDIPQDEEPLFALAKRIALRSLTNACPI